jgi:hypothetical protein
MAQSECRLTLGMCFGHPVGCIGAEVWRDEDEAVDAAIAERRNALLRFVPVAQHEHGRGLLSGRGDLDDAAEDFHEVEIGVLLPVAGDDADGVRASVREGAGSGVGSILQPFGRGNDARAGLCRCARSRLRTVQHHRGRHHRHTRLTGDIGKRRHVAAATGP